MKRPGANIPTAGTDSQIECTTHRGYRRPGERHVARSPVAQSGVCLNPRALRRALWREIDRLSAELAL